jgi:hypothetical protein
MSQTLYFNITTLNIPLSISSSSGGGGGGGGSYSPNATGFNGSTQYISKASGAIGADGKIAMMSLWIWPSDANTRTVMGLEDLPIVGIQKNGAGTVVLYCNDSIGTNQMVVTSATTLTQATWSHILLSFDLTNSSNRWLYINDVADSSANWSVYNNTNINFSRSSPSGIAANSAGGSKFSGSLSEVYLSLGTALDLSVSSNRRLFYSSTGHPAGDLGTNGAPAPALYLKNAYTSFGTNSGTMGDFTIQGGPLVPMTAP